MAEFPTLVVRNYSELVDALVAVKNYLQISNSALEEVAGMTAGAVDKYLGPTRSKGLGPLSLDLLLGGLAIRLRVEPDLAQARKLERVWENRDQRAVRQPARISKALLERARPIILSELARKGWQTRQQRAQAARAPAQPAEQQAAPAAA